MPLKYKYIYKEEGSNGGYPIDEESHEIPYKCPICGDCFDDLGNLIEEATDWVKGEECENCKAAVIYNDKLSLQEMEMYENLYNLQKGGIYEAGFWVFMASHLGTQIHIAKKVMQLIKN